MPPGTHQSNGPDAARAVSDMEWIDSRRPELMTSSEKKKNAELAIHSRRIPRKPGTPARGHFHPEKNAISAEKIFDTPERKESLLDSSCEFKKRLKKASQQSSKHSRVDVRKGHRDKELLHVNEKEDEVENGSNDDGSDIEVVSDDRIEIKESGINNSETDSEDDRQRRPDITELDKVEKLELAEQMFEKCRKFSSHLRETLSQWNRGPNKEGNRDCLNLVDIPSDIDSGELLQAGDLKEICPTLLLKPYQLVGVNWLKLIHLNNINGVLADDMGLGKTVQTIAFLSWLKINSLRGSTKIDPHLIVVPASTLSNWKGELSRFAPGLNTAIYHGNQKERWNLMGDLFSRARRGILDVVVTTYTLFERDSGAEDRRFLRRLNFDYLVLDEAHCIKNSLSSRYRHLKNLNSRSNLLLSGTPVQNDIRELLSLLSFLMPRTFRTYDCEVLLDTLHADGTEENLLDSIKENQHINKEGSDLKNRGLGIESLRQVLAPFVLRRLKRDVLDQLAPKVVEMVALDMNPHQTRLYQETITAYSSQKEAKKFIANEENNIFSSIKYQTSSLRGNGKCIDLSTDQENSTNSVERSQLEKDDVGDVKKVRSPVRTLTSLEARSLFTALRKAANHPLLLRVRYTKEDDLRLISQAALTSGYFGNQCDIAKVREEIESSSDLDIHRICSSMPSILGHLALSGDTLYESPKTRYLKDALPRLYMEGHRILLFSQWTMILDILELVCEDIDMNFLRLDGSTPIRERQRMIDKFNAPESSVIGSSESIPIFLLSTKAGGLGINLTAADTVILHDLDFNPENDRQAEDRCHRIGQKRPVTIYKLVTRKTVEQQIYDMGERKLSINKAVLSDNRTLGAEQNVGHENIGSILQVWRDTSRYTFFSFFVLISLLSLSHNIGPFLGTRTQ
jgi:SWI/SNF-related matrix-associated actin-dependent regulator 1 of chromatin subfamily A